MGKPVRYDGSAKSLVHPLLKRLMVEERLVVICPELSAGFSVPRSPAEISNREIGEAVLEGMAKVTEIDGNNVTDIFIAGANAALKPAVETGENLQHFLIKVSHAQAITSMERHLAGESQKIRRYDCTDASERYLSICVKPDFDTGTTNVSKKCLIFALIKT